MRIGIAQIDSVPGAFDQTVERMVAHSVRAAEQGVELLVFPLAALTGVDVVTYADRASYLSDVIAAVGELCERLAVPSLVPLLLDTGDIDGVHEVLLVRDGVARPLRGVALDLPESPRYGSDARHSDTPCVFSFGGQRIGIALTFDELDGFADAGVDVALFISSYPFIVDDLASALGADLDSGVYQDVVRISRSWLVAVGTVGGYADGVHTGSSFVMSPSGDVVALAPAFEEALLVAEAAGNGQELPAVKEPSPFPFDLPLHLWQTVSLGIHDYVAKRGRTDVALLLDGSISSQVLLALASDAVGPLHVHAVVGLTAGSRAAACRSLARRLHVSQSESVGPLADLDYRDLDELALAALARHHDAIVLSSLDKTALALGGFAGQVSCAELCPLGDIFRSDLLEMARARNTISPLFRGLSIGTCDTLELRMPDGSTQQIATEAKTMQVDEVLLDYLEYDRSLAAILADWDGDPDLVDAVLRVLRTTEAERRAMPPIIPLSTRSLESVALPLGMLWQDTKRASAEAGLFDRLARLASEEADEEPVEEPEPGVGEEPSDGPDLEGTLSMLRDLAEQGGFGLQGIAGIGLERMESVEGVRREALERLFGPLGPFSEN